MSIPLSTQYGRACSLIVGDAAGNGLDLSLLRVTFVVNKADVQTPAHAIIRVYNPSPETARQVQQEFTRVVLQAGYSGNLGVIFKGTVSQARYGRENPTDTFLEIVAADGDEAYNFATMQTTLAAGWKQDTLHDAIVKALDPYDVVAGYTPEFVGKPMPRAKVCYGMARDFMRTLAESCGASWHIADGALNVIPTEETLPGEAVVLTRETGLIGMPQQTINGISVRSLLNPKIRHGGQVRLDNASVQLAQVSVAYGAVNYFPSLDADGAYKVYSVMMHGDTRGQAWYSDLVCAAVDGTGPITGPAITTVPSSTGY